jgi:hypothetical protein
LNGTGLSQGRKVKRLKIVQGIYLINAQRLYRELTGKQYQIKRTIFSYCLRGTNQIEKSSPHTNGTGKGTGAIKRAQNGRQGTGAPTQPSATEKGKKSDRNFWKRHPPHRFRIRFPFAGRLPVWGGYPSPQNLRHIFDIALTFPTQKTTQKSSFQ